MSKIHRRKGKINNNSKIRSFFSVCESDELKREIFVLKFLSKLPLRENFAEFLKESNGVYL